jgi:hypothetical protein
MGGRRPLTTADRLEIFRIATASLVHGHGEQLKSGMTDAELEAALAHVLGIFGGSAGPGKPSVSFAGAGLRIWGSWDGVNHVVEKPLFAGRQTIAMAREVYAIPNPDEKQLKLF